MGALAAGLELALAVGLGPGVLAGAGLGLPGFCFSFRIKGFLPVLWIDGFLPVGFVTPTPGPKPVLGLPGLEFGVFFGIMGAGPYFSGSDF